MFLPPVTGPVTWGTGTWGRFTGGLRTHAAVARSPTAHPTNSNLRRVMFPPHPLPVRGVGRALSGERQLGRLSLRFRRPIGSPLGVGRGARAVASRRSCAGRATAAAIEV